MMIVYILRNYPENWSSIKNIRKKKNLWIVLKNMEVTQHSTGLLLGNQVDALPAL